MCDKKNSTNFPASVPVGGTTLVGLRADIFAVCNEYFPQCRKYGGAQQEYTQTAEKKECEESKNIIKFFPS